MHACETKNAQLPLVPPLRRLAAPDSRRPLASDARDIFKLNSRLDSLAIALVPLEGRRQKRERARENTQRDKGTRPASGGGGACKLATDRSNNARSERTRRQ